MISRDAPIKCIIDTDPGIDDAMALLFALRCSALDVLALTIVFGNSRDVEMLCGNANKILEMSGRKDIPVYSGATEPLNGFEEKMNSGAVVHGPDALGGLDHPWLAQQDSSSHIKRDKSASKAIVDLCRASPGQILLITLGPLTNVALALHHCPELPSLAKGIVSMAGAINCPGNKTPVAEANVHNDPEAAKIVLNACFHLTLVPLNVTRMVHMDPAFLGELRGIGRVGDVLWQMLQHYIKVLTKWGVPGHEIPMHDSSAVIAAGYACFFDSLHVYVDVETCGERTRGMCVADCAGHYRKVEENHATKVEKTKVLLDADASSIKRLYLDVLSAAYSHVT